MYFFIVYIQTNVLVNTWVSLRDTQGCFATFRAAAFHFKPTANKLPYQPVTGYFENKHK